MHYFFNYVTVVVGGRGVGKFVTLCYLEGGGGVLSDDQLFYVFNLQPLKLFVKKINYLLKSEQRVSSSNSNCCLLRGLIKTTSENRIC